MNFDNNTHDKTDEELVGLTLENQEFFAVLMGRYTEKLKKYVMRSSNADITEAEDIVQETFIKVYYNLNGFDQSLKFSSWIYRITHNQMISHFRKKKARPQSANFEEKESILESIKADFDIKGDIDHQYLKENIYRVLNEMPVKYKEVLVLKFLEEKDYKEISDILKKPVGTVGTLINRAKKQFVKILENNNFNLQ